MILVNRILPLFIFHLFLISCSKIDIMSPTIEIEKTKFIDAVDLSSLPEVLVANPAFFDLEGEENDVLSILKNSGVNTVRLKLWVNPDNEHAGWDEVKQFSKTLKAKGFKTWLAIHYSDTWADPAHQQIPKQWLGASYPALKDSVYSYTEKIMTELQPDYVQIGNEINTGFLHPHGHLSNQFQQFAELMGTAIAAVRADAADTQIIIHYAGPEGSQWFYDQVRILDYDIIGLSYYPIWHGKSLDHLKNTMQALSEAHDKSIVIAETAYPFTLAWNDWTNNIVGLEAQLILPDFPATPQGQSDFVGQIKTLTKDLDDGIGFCYWGGELIAWKGPSSTDASPWENQAIFDFDNRALPVLEVFDK